jgi:acetyl-CoA carboxylase biotin carboxylase subunit
MRRSCFLCELCVSLVDFFTSSIGDLMLMFSKILIANRGEIAVRLLRACRELGIAGVAVYSDADRQALHVRLADDAVCIGPAPAAESYLNVERILQAARQTGAQAVHPGYGFLAENAAFAEAVQAAGLAFIGPPPDAIRRMGDKAAARARMQAAGVPVVPGYQGPDNDPALEQEAARLGYPVLVKAAAGGGGKGMRVVHRSEDLSEGLAAARREAQHAFGDSRLVLERYIPRAHHVEFQVLGDHHGNLVHVFERECSLQRRHQKVIEETPSPLLDEGLRVEMGAAAVAAARAVGYTNAGTVEFIVDPGTCRFYFLEMNTRLQVEHPITELVAGLDLAQWQVRIAAGERLPFAQADLAQRGHAIECRLYAEDPAAGFLPATGPLLRFIQPQGPGVRVDSGVAAGDEITIHYDPLIAKLIVHAEDRPAAIRKMQTALRETVLLGVVTNWQFLQDVLAHPDFEAGRAHTTWIEATFEGWRHPHCELPPEVLVAAALTQFAAPGAGAAASLAQTLGDDLYSPWKIGSNYRMGEA